ncbi:MAG: tyrosine-type recombinase/integrase [Bacteroidota bacterium]
MATINYFVSGKKRKTVPIYVRFSAGRGVDLIVKSDITVNPKQWSNTTQTIKQRIRSDADEKFIKELKNLYDNIEIEGKNYHGEYSKEWLQDVIYKYHNKKTADAKTLNEYTSKFIDDAKKGERKNKSSMNLAPGTIRILEGFKRIFGIYQGIYSEKDIKEIEKKNESLKEDKKPLITLRPVKKVDFENINIDFYNSFVNFLSDEGYSLNTQGRFIKGLKMMMKKSLQEKLHSNRDFQFESFRGISAESFSISLTPDELDKIYKYDLSQPENKRQELARDAWFILYETCLRISDYSKIEVNIRIIESKRIIDIYQTKTNRRVLIPLTARFEAIWNKYEGKLPKIPDQYINKYIKTIAFLCGITEVVRWPVVQYGKTFERTAKKYEKISCHSARRSGATILYKEGVPISDIMILLGHHTEKQTKEYIKISAEEAVLRLSEHPHYSALKAV